MDDGILAAHRYGILTSTTLMANGAAFDHAVQLARQNPTLDIGCHLALIGGRSLLPPYAPLPASVSELLGALALRRLDLYAELSAQVRKILDAGLRPTHLDTHKHTHLAPPVLNAVARVSRDFAIPWVRRPFDFPFNSVPAPLKARTVSRALALLRGKFDRVLAAHGCRTTDQFAGFLATGRFETRDMVALIRSLPEGVTEFMCHPGYCTGELRAAPTRLKESRQRELDALIAPETRAAVHEGGVELVNYTQI